MGTVHKLKGPNSSQLCTVVIFSILQVANVPGKCFATDIWPQTNNHTPNSRSLYLADAYWTDSDEDGDVSLLSRQRRAANGTSESKSVWQKIEDFYANKNNMAMYCVLPILVLVYGGCSAIYCVYKCRQYIKKRKHKRLKEEDCDSVDTDKTGLDTASSSQERSPDRDRPVSQISSAWTDLQVDAVGSGWSGHTEGKPLGGSSPLPWSVPCRNEATASNAHNQSMSHAGYIDDSLRNDDLVMTERNRSSASGSDTIIILPLVSGRRPGDGRSSEATVPEEKCTQNQLQTSQRPPAKTKTGKHPPGWEPRPLANLTEYATNSSTATKAADYSRFSDNRPIEIIPLSADPNLCSYWDPLHNRPFGGKDQSQNQLETSTDLEGTSGSEPVFPGGKSVIAMKDEIMAKYDAFSTFQMAKRAAEILNTGASEKSREVQQHKSRKKHIFITE